MKNYRVMQCNQVMWSNEHAEGQNKSGIYIIEEALQTLMTLCQGQ